MNTTINVLTRIIFKLTLQIIYLRETCYKSNFTLQNNTDHL